MTATAASLDVCFEAASIQYNRVQVGSDGASPRFVRQTNTSHSPYTNEAETRRWEVTATFTTYAEWVLIEAAWNATKGGIYPLAWTPPDESTPIAVRPIQYDPTYSAPDRFEVRMVLEEDF